MKSVIFSILVLFGGCVFAQPGFKLFSSSINLSVPKGKGGYIDQDGNKLILVCDRSPASETQADICLIKLGLSDEVLWSKKYHISSTDEEAFPSIVENGDFYFIVGNTGYWSSQIDGLILKVRKSDGVCVLAKKFGGTLRDMFNSGIKTSPNSFTVCGWSLNDSFVASSGFLYGGDGIMVELSWNLDTLRTLRLGANNRFDRFDFMKKSSNGDLLLVGVKSPPTGSTNIDNDDLTLVRLSSSLTPIFARTYNHSSLSSSGSGYEQPMAFFEGSGGRIYIVNKLMVVDKTQVLKLDRFGSVISSRAFNDVQFMGGSLIHDKLMVYGQKDVKGVVSMIDTSSLNSLWARVYDFGSTSYSLVWSLYPTLTGFSGFGFSHGASKVAYFTSDNNGSIGWCGGDIDATTSTPLLVDVSRAFPYQTERFRYSGVDVSVATQDISVSLSVCENVALPVELVSFRGEVEARGINLSWSTASERNVSHFVIEKSEDALRFDSIGFVEAVGNSVTLQDYGWLDEDAKQGIRYYRLRSVDEDGTEETSSVVFVSFDLTVNKFLVFPNPASRKVTIRGATGEVLILNTFGQIVERQFAPDIDVGALPTGVYTLWLIQTNDQVRLVVE